MTVTAIDWDQWRADYDTMSFAEHQAFNADCLRLHPEQRSFNAEACAKFLEQRQPRVVIELGGWDGALAALMLERFAGIETWLNYDITPDVPQVCSDARYDVFVLDEWPWEFKATAHALVASHVFEHMRLHEIERLVTTWDVDSIFVDMPIGGGTDWQGYTGSHILDCSTEQFLAAMDTAGYAATYSRPGMVAHLDRRAA